MLRMERTCNAKLDQSTVLALGVLHPLKAIVKVHECKFVSFTISYDNSSVVSLKILAHNIVRRCGLAVKAPV